MSQETYQQLLKEFRTAWSKHADDLSQIVVVSPSSISPDSPAYDSEKYELIGQVCLPFDVPGDMDTGPIEATLGGYAIADKGQTTPAARECFRQLIQAAGASLPMKILDTLDPLSPGLRGTDGPDSKWLALLILMQGLAAYTREAKYTGKGFLYQPFRLCIDAIEYYRLNTDKPSLRPSEESKEGKQKKEKGRPKVTYEQEQVAYSIDFRSVLWFGEEYCFTPNQAAVVKVLFEHWERGVPDVGNETLLMAIDREAPPDRLNMVFRGHPGWGKLIVSGGTKGTHRLSDGENKVF